MPLKLPGSLLVLLVAISLGSITTMSLCVLGVVLAVLALGSTAIYLIRRPQKSLMFSFFLVILADTKFRARDPAASLSGDIDAQIVFELVLYGFIGLVIFINMLSSSFRDMKSTPMEFILLCYVLVALVSSFWSYNFQLTAVRATQLLILYAFCFLAVRVLGPQGVLRALTVSVVLYVVLLSFMALIFPWANGTRLTHITEIPRFSWFSVHPILAGSVSAIAAILIMAEALFAPGSWRRRIMGLPLWVYIIPVMVILVATRSRGPLVGFAVAMFALLVRKYGNPWMAGFVGCFVGYLGLVGVVISLGFGFSFKGAIESLLSADNTLTLFLSRGESSEDLLSVSGRTELWQGVYALFLERPILGYGYVASRKVLVGVLSWGGQAHNGFAETLLNLGIAGTALIWFALGRALVSSLFRPSQIAGPVAWHQAAILGALVVLLFNSFVDATFTGLPGYQVVLFFSSVFAHDRLRLRVQSEKKELVYPCNSQSIFVSRKPAT